MTKCDKCKHQGKYFYGCSICIHHFSMDDYFEPKEEEEENK